jgi:hypothetical protein
MKLRDSRRSLTIALALLFLVGCATTAPKPADVPVDYSNEIGENGLLTPRAIFTRYVEALGGAEALEAHDSSITRGKLEMAAMGLEGAMTIWASAPNRFVMEVELGGMGTMRQGYNGEVGYAVNPMTGPMVLEGQQLSQMLQQADFYGPLNWQETFPTAETLELADFNGAPAYKVRLVDTTETEIIQYFDEGSSLMVGFEGNQASPMGEVFVTASVGDYEEFGGILVPTTTSVNMMGSEIRTTVESVSYEPVDESVFELPDAVKALVE